jgi:MoaA/NifB/PqqE/SkfB family radical SAM enzyme
MRSQQVFTNYRCNQNCGFCIYRRETDDPRAIAPPEVRAQIDRAIDAGARSVVFTGGEPTMRRDLAELVRHARARGAEEVVVETNATLVGPELARALVEGGMTCARVHLPRATAALDDITRDPGGFEAAMGGMLALRDAGATLEVAVPIVRSTAASVAEIPGVLGARLGDAVRRIVVKVPVESRDPAELLAYGDAVQAILALDASCRQHGIHLQLADHQGPPPCAFPARGRPHHLYALNRGAGQEPGGRHLAGCASCVVRDRCPGVPEAYLARHPDTVVAPITDDRARRRLSMVDSVERQIARELVQPSFPATGLEEALVRINFHCNQACDFCFVSTHLPAAPVDAVRQAIEGAAAEGKRVVLTGGEPTTNARLTEYVGLAREVSRGRWPVEIQTNAVLLDDEKRVEALVLAGLGAAFVSLHGSRAEIGDAVTRAPGTFARTLAGIDNLVRAGVTVVLNFVICTANQDDLPDVVQLASARWPGVALNVSFIAPSTDVVPCEPWLVPRYSDVLPRLEQARARAALLGVKMIGFESMCGIPLCLVPAELTTSADGRTIPQGADDGEFMRVEACADCDLSTRCWGVRRSYAGIHGTGEMRPVRMNARPRGP